MFDPPVALRPLTRPDIVDGAIAVLKAAPRTMLGLSAVVMVPVELLSAWLRRDQLASSGLQGAFRAVSGQTTTGVDGSGWGVLVLSSLALSIVTAAVAQLVLSSYQHRELTGRAALVAALRRFPALLGGWVLVKLTEVLGGVLLGVGAVAAMALGAMVAPVIGVEGGGGFHAIRRSWSLARPNFGGVFGAVLLIFLVDGLLGFCLQGIALVPRLVVSGDGIWVLDALASSAAAIATVPFVAAAATLVYLDCRVRSEGLDIEIALEERFAA